MARHPAPFSVSPFPTSYKKNRLTLKICANSRITTTTAAHSETTSGNFSPRTSVILAVVLNSKYYNFFPTFPINWDPVKSKLVFHESKWSWFRWKVNMTLAILICIVSTGNSIVKLCLGRLNVTQVTGAWVTILGQATALIGLLAWQMWVHVISITSLVNAVYMFYEVFKDKYDKSYSIYLDTICAAEVIGLCGVLRSIIIPIGSVFLFKNELSLLGTFVCPESPEGDGGGGGAVVCSGYTIITLWIIQHYLWTILADAIACYCCLVMPAITYVYYMIHKIRDWKISSSEGTGTLIITQRCYIQTYRHLQLIFRCVNGILSEYLMPGHLVLVGIILVFTMYVLIRLSLDILLLSIVLALLSLITTYLVAILFPVAQLSKTAYNLNKKKLHCGNDKYWRRVYKSCAPMGLEVGSYFILTKRSVLMYLYRIIDMLVTLLIATK